MNHTLRRTARVVALSLAVLLLPATLAAQTDKEEAKTHFQNGLSMMELEDFAGAAVEFEASLQSYPTKNAMFNLGMCYKALHRYAKALEIFRQVLKDFGGKLGDEMRSEVRKNIAAINKMLAQLEIHTNIPGATILVDGEKVGTTPLEAPVDLGAGEHRIRASLPGYEDQEKVVVVAAQTKETVEIELTPVVAPAGGVVPPPAMGSKGNIVVPPGVTAPSRPVFDEGYRPPAGSVEPPQPPATAGQVPKEGDRAAKIYGIGIGIQGLAGAIGLGAYYGSDSDENLNNVGAWYFLATTAGSGVLTWLFGNGSYYYDVPIWGMYIGSVVGGGLGWLVDWLIWNKGMERDIPDIDDPEMGLAAFGMAVLTLAVAPIGPAIAYAIFKKPEPRFRKDKDKPKPIAPAEAGNQGGDAAPAAPETPAEPPAETVSLIPPSVFPMRSMDGTGRTCLGIHIIGGTF